MNGQKSLEPINVLLSREELLFVLNSLEADFIPGLDMEPQGELTVAQELFGMTVAGRALRARELARVQAGGQLQIHNALLTMVGVCAYAQHVIFAYHWPTNAEMPTRYFGHIRENDIVAHTRPEDVLHLFSLLPSKEQLIEQVLAVCQCDNVAILQPFEFFLSDQIFAQARELAGAGEVEKVVNLLLNNSVATDAAKSFVDTLARSPRVSIMQTVKQPGKGIVQKRDFTLLQNGQQAWLAIAPEDSAAGGPLRIKTTSRVEIQALLREWL